ncbi:hypothetical protein D9756_002896 [Leucocoprinus leucothites]|uniref:Uncharacterized protein n=1 Tax=Leucocoprinus leucothites TaxID=201217 RepID=A0A8H5LJC2_9AGAR|nr:hypothetical protein D9756_002896 [Leucoagaricus leucothites]
MATSASPYPSPASSSTSLVFPKTSSPTKGDSRSNPHPYAIKTTSTGILTRSNSTHSTTSSHRFVPSSPSKPKASHPRHSGGHKYSRSLNQELPRPLPVPPNFPSSASPTKTEFEPQDVPILGRRERRSDTLPSLSQPNLLESSTVADELPEDPRVWTPSQLSTHLTSSLRVTSGDIPPLVAQDMATFVRTEKINGRKFLRLTEGDLDKFGLNQRWQTALLGASRSLRQNSLRGRIWNSGFSPDLEDGEQEDDNYNSFSSSSSRSSMDSTKGLHRGRPESGSGRVKGMVASFERSGPSRSVSPLKGSGRNSLSPVKRLDDEHRSPDSGTNTSALDHSNRSRPRPQSDIFPSRSSYAMNPTSIEGLPTVNNSSNTTTNPSGGDPEQKREPRLLPLPPQLSGAQVLPPEFTQPVQHMQGGVPEFGPYGSPQLPSTREMDISFTPAPFPSGILPFSPQSTGTSILSSPSPDDHIGFANQTQTPPLIPFTPAPGQAQSFDALYVNALAEGVRPLPLPPHQGQYYQPLASASGPQGYTGDDGSVIMGMGDGLQMQSGESGVPPSLSFSQFMPHGSGESANGLPIMVPHVQVQHVPESSHHSPPPTAAQAPIFDIQHLPPHQLHQQHPVPLQHFNASQPTYSFPESQGHHHLHPAQGSQPIQILAPQPRHGGRSDSPTKILEEKLEELLEPRPRSRVVSTSRPHSRVASISKRSRDKGQNPSTPGSPSRPRSRVTSMNLAGDGNGSLRLKSSSVMDGDEAGGEAAVEENKSNGVTSLEATANDGNDTKPSINMPSVSGPQQHHPRTRVISLSSRTHSHRLSGVEAWGESHRHIVVPSDDSELNATTLHTVEDGGVKELEGEEDVGIEALLEKEVPALPIPVPINPHTPEASGGHVKESSAGSTGSGGSVAHSRSGSLREPKSAVITVVERKSSSRLSKVDIGNTSGGDTEEVEESIEALLAKADAPRPGPGLGSGVLGRAQKKRMPLSGADAWEMVNVDTIKHVDGGDGQSSLSKSVEDIFSPTSSAAPRPPAVIMAAPAPHGPRPKQTSPPPSQQQSKAKLKPKSRTSLSGDSDAKGTLDEIERKEMELEKNVVETRKMVEEVKGRLESVERWIADSERKAEIMQKAKEERERANVWSMTRRVLSASRVPGMLGLGAWFGAPSSPSSPSSRPSSSSSTSTSGSANTKTQSRVSLIRRIAKLGLNLSTYAVLFGIGICVVLLRALGKRPGVIARFGGVGVGARLGNGVGGR